MNQTRALYLLLAVFVLLGVFYSVTTPLFETPDEQWHFAFVQNVAQGRGLPVQALPLQHLARQEGSQPPLYYVLAAALTFWIDTTDYPAIARENPHYGFDVPGIVNDNKNLFIHTAQEAFPFHNTSLVIHLARILSILMGAVAVYFTYRTTLQIANGKWQMALAAAALVAFTPQFLFISAAVSNDSTLVALCAVALLLLVRTWSHPPAARDTLLIGAVCGLCALAKVSGLAMLPLAALVIAYQNRRNVRTLIMQELFLGAAFAVVAGWWYVRNILLYGELTGTARMVEIFGGRVAPLTLDGWRAQFGEVFETFWVGFGWGNIRAPQWFYIIVALALLLATVGLAMGVLRSRRVTLHRASSQAVFWRIILHPLSFALVVLAAWALIVFLALIQWMIQTQAPHGRLLFPALPAFAVLIVVGWTQLIPARFQFLVLRAAPAALFLFAVAAPFLLLTPAYAYPPALAESEIAAVPSRVDIRYGDTLMLLGSRLTPHPVDPRGALQVDLYWRVLNPTTTDYSLNLSVLDENNRVTNTRISFPGHGTLPTSALTAGQMFHDTYWLPTRTQSGTVQLSVFDRTTQQDLPAFDPANNEITPIINRFALEQ